MNALDRKLLRDLWRMRGQIIAIVLVIVSGISSYIMLASTMQSLDNSRNIYYESHQFANVFASLKRAPEGLITRILEIPGVDRAESRISAYLKLDIKGYVEPVTARVVSIPDDGQPVLNKIFIRKGRLPDGRKPNEALVSEAFANAHGLKPGESFGAVINGKWEKLIITGIALSPEFILQIRPGALSPDYKRFGIVWMGRTALSAAYNMEGAFNDLTISLTRGVTPESVIPAVDHLLNRYGGRGAYAREDQLSHRYLSEEFRQLKRSSQVYPAIFIMVSAYLLNVVLSRLIGTQREQIGTLKAFGYSNSAIAIHYMKMVVVISFIGVAGGLAGGIQLGKGLGGLYMEFYRLPYLHYEVSALTVITALAVTVGSALCGTLYSVWKASNCPPAQAMRPEPPMSYRESVLEYIGMRRFFSQTTRMIVRNIERKPFKSSLTVIGIAFSCAIIIAGRFANDSVSYMLDVQFKIAHKEDLTVSFIEPASLKTVYEIKRMPGVEYVEPFRSVPVRFRFGHRDYKSYIQGVTPESRLYSVLDENLKPVSVPHEGLVMTDWLCHILGVKPGDIVIVEFLEGRRHVKEIPVVAMTKQYIGVSGYMDMTTLNRMAGEGNTASGVYISADSLYIPKLFAAFISAPLVAGTTVRSDDLRNFYETQAKAFLFFTYIATLLSATIAFGVIYNSSRIALSERSWELASLRVLGFTRKEISYILLGELAIFTITAIPAGFLIGNGICTYMANAFATDLYRIPVVIQRSTYSLAATTVIISSVFSGLLVMRKLGHLDLVAALKTKE